MTIQTNRRAILAGIPAAAFVATIPGTLNAAPADNAVWERVKADFANACQRYSSAQDAYTRADGERIDYGKTAPEREVIYTREGWRAVTEEVHIEVKDSTAPFTLRRSNYTDPLIVKGLKGTPGYTAYAAEVEVWEAGREAHAEACGWIAVQQEWEDALAAQTEAWNTLIACPVETAPQVAEKLALARSVYIEDDEAARLMDAINADLTRITAH
jgi:hypothetical protein